LFAGRARGHRGQYSGGGTETLDKRSASGSNLIQQG
jgi:hypothetical protein